MAKEQRKLKIPYSKTIIIFEIITFIVVVLSSIFFAVHYNKLPLKIATRWNAAGIADGWSNRSYALILPGIMAVLYLALTVVSNVPAIYGRKIDVRTRNVEKKYKNARDFLIWGKIEMSLMLALVTVNFARTGNMKINVLFTVVLFVFAIIFLCTLFYFKNKKSQID